jgi:tetratricopeptide (TPR) repeat protein
VARNPSRTWAAYLDLYRHVDRDAFPTETAPATYTATASSTWKVSVDAAAAESPVAPRLLDALAFLAPDNIPLELFYFDESAPLLQRSRRRLFRRRLGSPIRRDVYLGFERLEVEGAFDILHGYSLIDLTADVANVHRVVQHVTRATAPREALTFDAKRLAQLVPRDPTNPAAWPLSGRLEPHVRAVANHAYPPTPDTASAVAYALDRMAGYLEYSGSIHAAIPLFERALADRLEVLGDRHPQTLAAVSNLASSYRWAGRLDEAIVLQEKVLAASVEVLGDRRPETLTARGNLALSYWSAARLDEAIRLQEKVLAASVEVLGDRHPDTLKARANLANSYQFVGRLDEAIPLLDQVLAASVEVLGDRHPDTLKARANLANSYRFVGRLDEAITLLREAIRVADALPFDHPYSPSWHAMLEQWTSSDETTQT